MSSLVVARGWGVGVRECVPHVQLAALAMLAAWHCSCNRTCLPCVHPHSHIRLFALSPSYQQNNREDDHEKVLDMVLEALKALYDRQGGASLLPTRCPSNPRPLIPDPAPRAQYDGSQPACVFHRPSRVPSCPRSWALRLGLYHVLPLPLQGPVRPSAPRSSLSPNCLCLTTTLSSALAYARCRLSARLPL